MKNLSFLPVFLLFFFRANAQTITPNDGNWASLDTSIANTPECELMVRTGDIDNMGFGWPAGFDPFSGMNTPSHSYPWTPNAVDPAGTDRIMVITSYVGSTPFGQDGYTSGTSRPGNSVRPVALDFTFTGTVTHAYLYAFLDDFQAPLWHASYQVTLDSIRIPLYESVVNTLLQTGPIGKIVKLPIPNNLLYLLNDGKLQIKFDDVTTGAGDGYAIDFVKLVINPVNTEGSCVLKGKVTDFFSSGAPIAQVKVTANGLDSAYTDANGDYRIEGVDPGILFVQTYKAGYGAEQAAVTLAANDSAVRNFLLKTGAPQLIYNQPANGAVQVAKTARIKMRFNQPIDNATFGASSFLLSNGQSQVNGSYQTSGDTLIFIPDSLENATTYKASVTVNLKSSGGVPLDRDYTFSFQTFNPVAVKEVVKAPEHAIFPNPVSQSFLVSGLEKGGLYRIVGSDGRLVLEEYYTGSVSMAAWPGGIYSVVLPGKGKVIRFVKE